MKIIAESRVKGVEIARNAEKAKMKYPSVTSQGLIEWVHLSGSAKVDNLKMQPTQIIKLQLELRKKKPKNYTPKQIHKETNESIRSKFSRSRWLLSN